MTTKPDANEMMGPEGFLSDPDLWDRDLAERIAADFGIQELKVPHWKVIDYLREHYLDYGSLPWETHVCRSLDLHPDCIHSLFGGSVEAWKVAGLPDPGEEARTYMLNQEE